jgi:hypothetical protein
MVSCHMLDILSYAWYPVICMVSSYPILECALELLMIGIQYVLVHDTESAIANILAFGKKKNKPVIE